MFDFPNSPVNGQTITMPDGTVRRWDGTKWMAGASPTSPVILCSDTPPSNPQPNWLWWDSVGAQLYIYYNDGTSSQWVPANATTAQIPGVQNNVGRNLAHNSMFNIAERGQGPWTVNGYTLDRWRLERNTDTLSVSQLVVTDAQRTSIGDESALYCLGSTFTGTSGAPAYSFVQHRLEELRQLGSKTITVSFWAWCGTGTLKLGVNLSQNFGTGGSPSATVDVAGQFVTLSTTPTRYSLTFALPSTSGKIIGTNLDGFTALTLWLSAGSNKASVAGNIGVQSGTISLWGVQLEIGNTMTPFEKTDIPRQVLQCARFYQFGYFGVIGYQVAGMPIGGYAYFITEMRAPPTLVINTVGSDSNVASMNAPALISVTGFQHAFTAAASGVVVATRSFNASADL
jgi:hypothetical protein